jgi:hypothetical protein
MRSQVELGNEGMIRSVVPLALLAPPPGGRRLPGYNADGFRSFEST